jgi:multimeric flavodoxin WrbA
MCFQEDDFEEFFHSWLEVDGVIYATPVFHMSIPAQLKAVIDRLGHVFFAHFNRFMPRFCKAGGVIAQGSSPYGGQEFAMQYLVQHLLTVNCVPVPGDKPWSYIGAGGLAKTWDKGSILEDATALNTASNVGCRVAEMAKILKTGRCGLEDLPREYDYRSLITKNNTAEVI